MIDRSHDLPVTRQCRVLQLSRSSVYYRQRPVSEENLELMRRMDELHLEYPFFGARGLMKLLRREGHHAGRERIARLMRLMAIHALYRKPNSSRRHPNHPVYPYLLRSLMIDRPNHVWAADITYIPMRRGFVFLFAVMDWASRRVMSWRLSNTLTTDFCVEALNEAITRHGTPEICNTDQGCQFTSMEFTGLLKQNGIAISMDGKGCWRDNVFVARLWRTSNTRRFICMGTTASPRQDRNWIAILGFTTRGDLIRRLTTKRRTSSTSKKCPCRIVRHRPLTAGLHLCRP